MKKIVEIKKNLLFLVVGTLLLSQCIPTEPDESCKIKIIGSVVDILANPIEGAEIKQTNTEDCCEHYKQPCSYSTDSKGNWYSEKDLNYDRVRLCNVEISKIGYKSINLPYEIDCLEKNIEKEIKLDAILEVD
jgi:hypothetical protein